MKAKVFFTFILSLIFAFLANGQNLNTTIQKSFGGFNDDFLYDMHKAPDGSGYYFIGTSNSNISGTKSEISRGGNDAWIVKTDVNLNVLWDKTIGGSGDDFMSYNAIIDNKIYLLMYGDSPISGDKSTVNYGLWDLWLVCCELNGNILWQKQYGGSSDDFQGQIHSKTDSTLLLVSTSRSGISGNKTTPNYGFNDFWLVEISDIDGSVIQEKNIGSNGNENNVRLAFNKNIDKIYLLGTSPEGVSQDKTDPGYLSQDVWMLELDYNLNILSDKCYGGDALEQFGNIFIDDNDDIILSIATSSGISGNKTTPKFGTDLFTMDIWMVRLDSDLNELWQKNYGGFGSDVGSISGKNSNGNFILTAYSNSIPSGNKTSPRYGMSQDAWLLIIDSQGEIVAQETYGGTEDDFPTIYQDPYSSTGLIFAGGSLSNVSGNKTVVSYGAFDSWIGKIDASNFLNTEKLGPNNSTISVYPNPFLNTVHFDFKELKENVSLILYTVEGKMIYEKSISMGTQSIDFEPEVSNQVFIYRIKGETINKTGKIIKH